jgi:hypothetical protein
MTIKAHTVPNLSLRDDIRAEFGGPTTNVSLFAYRAGGAYVPGGTLGFPKPSGTSTAIASTAPISMNGFYGSSAVIAPTYMIVPSTTSANEGTSVTFTVTTTNVPNGTVLTWLIVWTGIGSAPNGSDFTDGQLMGTVTINSNTGSFVRTLVNDSLTEGVEQFQGRLWNGVSVLADSATVYINDTSTTPTAFTFTETISSNFTGGYNLRTRAMTPFVGSNGASAWNGTTPLNATVTVNSGIYVVGTLFASAFTTSTTPGTGPGGIPAGSTITLTNNGIIAGLGGVGGNGGSVTNASMTNGTVGGQGGTAFSPNHTISVYNNGTIGGGGGGGGGGGARYLIETYSDKSGTYTSYYAASGGGGGGGRANGVVGVNGTPVANAGNTGNFAYGPDSSATSGSFAAAGAGSSSGNVGPYGPDNMQGGAGGNLGQPGFPGGAGGGETSGNSSSGAGGAAGAAIIGGANILWYAYGTRLGTIDNAGTNMIPGGVTGPLNLFAISDYVGGSGVTIFADTTFQTNGNIQTREGDTTAIATLTDAGDWRTPNSPGIGGSYWVRFTRIAGSSSGYTGDTLGVWHSLSSNRMVGHSMVSIGSFQQRDGTYTAEISDNGGASTLVTHTITVAITYEF